MAIKEKKLLIKVIDVCLEDLVELSFELEDSSIESFYAEVLINYLQGDAEKLELIVARLRKGAPPEGLVREYQQLLDVSEFRLKLLRESYTEKEVDSFARSYSEDESESDSVWRGDVYSFCAFAYGKLNKHVKAKIYFKKAYNALWKLGAKRRALLALKNYVAAESNIYPEKKLHSEYQLLIRKSKELGFSTVAGSAHYNLSRQYHKNGAYLIALEEVEKALEQMSKNTGSQQYFLALAHKAHLLIELKRYGEAKVLVDKVSCCNHSRLQGTVIFLKDLLGVTASGHLDIKSMAPSWKERATSPENVKLGRLETQLLKFVSDRPRTKREIILHLYGEKLDYFVLENRFKNLIGRFRKKVPGLIEFVDDHYTIVDSKFVLEQIEDKDAS